MFDAYFSGLTFMAQTAVHSKWDRWPFHSGTTGDWQTTLATYAFSGAILAVICLFLRKLYGPGGIWRDKEMEQEAIQARQKALTQLDSDLRAGRINKTQYEMKKRTLDQ